MIPAPEPCSTRKPISEPISQAEPASAEPGMNSSSKTSQARLAPKHSAAQPVSGMTLATGGVYPVRTH